MTKEIGKKRKVLLNSPLALQFIHPSPLYQTRLVPNNNVQTFRFPSGTKNFGKAPH